MPANPGLSSENCSSRGVWVGVRDTNSCVDGSKYMIMVLLFVSLLIALLFSLVSFLSGGKTVIVNTVHAFFHSSEICVFRFPSPPSASSYS